MMSEQKRLLDELHIAIELRHESIAHQLVDELMMRGRREQHTRLQSTGAFEGTLSMLCVDPSDDTGENV